MNEPLISIVIATYNRSNDVVRAVESAIKQTYLNKEIIVVDDNELNSTEQVATKKNLERYINAKEIIYINNTNVHGGSGCRNFGIDVSKGEFVAFLDDDDEYFPEKIEKQYNYYKINSRKRKIGLIYCYAIGVNKNKEKITEYNNDIEGKVLYESMKGCIAGTSLWMASKKALIDIGGFYETPSKQDTLTIIKMLAHGYEVIRVPEKLVYYYEYIGNKISGSGINAIIGKNNVRDFSRTLYKLIDDKNKIKELEYGFSRELITLYIINKDIKNAKLELRNMIEIDRFNKENIKALGKIKLRFAYKIFLEINKHFRFK